MPARRATRTFCALAWRLPYVRLLDAAGALGLAEPALRRIEQALAGDPAGFWRLVRGETGDDLSWCGSAPLYTFLRVAPKVRGEVLHYLQWQIDSDSVVSCAGLAFSEALPREGE